MHVHALLRITLLALGLAGVAAVAPAMAQGHEHAATTPGTAATAGKSAQAEGEVRRIDRNKNAITLKHGPLTTLGMPAMTMTFTVADPKLLASVKEGDKVRFTPGKAKDGSLVVTAIEVVKG